MATTPNTQTAGNGRKADTMAALNNSDSPSCPCCGASERYSREDSRGTFGSLRVCRKCNALYTASGRSIYRGESYGIVSPHLAKGRPGDMDGAQYFDFTVLGSDGIGRRHGWFDPKTGALLQIG